VRKQAGEQDLLTSLTEKSHFLPPAPTTTTATTTTAKPGAGNNFLIFYNQHKQV
jgi:hypothetical protein